jgi:hypothetical protein
MQKVKKLEKIIKKKEILNFQNKNKNKKVKKRKRQ